MECRKQRKIRDNIATVTEKKWEKFERVVAAIHLAQAKGATVTWNEQIDGRQFDVVIRFKFQFYDYVVLIECKDQKSRVKASAVESFVTKSKDAKADKAIIVSSSGFQEGARKVARNHKVELFTLSQVNHAEELLTDRVISVLILQPIGFRKSVSESILLLPKDNRSDDLILFSQDTNKLAYEVNNTVLSDFGGMSAGELIRIFAQQLVPYEIPGMPRFPESSVSRATETQQFHEFTLPMGTKAIFPDGKEVAVSHLLFAYWMDKGRLMRPTIVDPTIYTGLGVKYAYTNELTSQSTLIDPMTLPFGVDNTFEAGKFYTQPALKFSYYCEDANETDATIVLVESYQHGQLVQARFKVPVAQATHYAEITNKEEIAQVKEFYARSIGKGRPTQLGLFVGCTWR